MSFKESKLKFIYVISWWANKTSKAKLVLIHFSRTWYVLLRRNPISNAEDLPGCSQSPPGEHAFGMLVSQDKKDVYTSHLTRSPLFPSYPSRFFPHLLLFPPLCSLQLSFLWKKGTPRHPAVPLPLPHCDGTSQGLFQPSRMGSPHSTCPVSDPQLGGNFILLRGSEGIKALHQGPGHVWYLPSWWAVGWTGSYGLKTQLAFLRDLCWRERGGKGVLVADSAVLVDRMSSREPSEPVWSSGKPSPFQLLSSLLTVLLHISHPFGVGPGLVTFAGPCGGRGSIRSSRQTCSERGYSRHMLFPPRGWWWAHTSGWSFPGPESPREREEQSPLPARAGRRVTPPRWGAVSTEWPDRPDTYGVSRGGTVHFFVNTAPDVPPVFFSCFPLVPKSFFFSFLSFFFNSDFSCWKENCPGSFRLL